MKLRHEWTTRVRPRRGLNAYFDFRFRFLHALESDPHGSTRQVILERALRRQAQINLSGLCSCDLTLV